MPRLVILRKAPRAVLAWLSITKFIVLALVGISAVAAVVGWRENMTQRLRFRAFEVAPDFAQAGYSGMNLSRAIADELYNLRDSAGSLSAMRPVRMADDKTLPPLNIEIKGQSISLSAVYQAIRSLGPDSAVDVQGELLRSDSAGELVVRVGARSKRIGFSAIKPLVPRSVLRDAGEFILLHTEPYILASYLMNSNPQRARELLVQLTRAREPRLRAQALLGQAYLANKTKDTLVDRERLFRLSMSADPTYAGPYVNLAAIYNYRDRNYEALAVLDSVPKDESRWMAAAANNRASILNDLGRHEEALEQARRAAVVADGLGPRLNAAKALLGMAKHEQGLVELDHAEIFGPSVTGIAILKAIAYRLAGRTDRARQSIRKIRTDSALALRADLLEADLIGPDSALALGRAAAAGAGRSRGVADLFSLLGSLLLAAGREAEAEVYMKEAERLDGDNPLVQWRLGQAACHRGDWIAAGKHLSRVIDLDTLLNGPLVRHRFATRCDSVAVREGPGSEG